MAKILGLDTSTEACSAALLVDNQVTEKYEVCPREHSSKILPMIRELLDNAQISLSDLDAIAVTRGPGSFTGVRLGICIAQGLAFASWLPIVPISTLEVVAAQAFSNAKEPIDSVLVSLDARMNEIYFGAYTLQNNALFCVVPEQVVSPYDLAPMPVSLFSQKVVGIGHGFDKFEQILLQKIELPLNSIIKDALPRAEILVKLAAQYFNQGVYVTPEQCQPVYLRNQIITDKRPVPKFQIWDRSK